MNKMRSKMKRGRILSPIEKYKALFLLMFARELIRNSGEDVFRVERLAKSKKIKSDELEKQIKKRESPRKKKPKKGFDNIRDIVKREMSAEEKSQKKPSEKNNLNQLMKDTEKGFTAPKNVPLAPPKKPPQVSGRPPVLRIPQQRLPPRLQYLRPTPTEREIDLGNKINPFVRDPTIREIECLGPNEEINVYGQMGRQSTDIALSKEEIERIVDKFSKESRIPTFDGVYKVVVGKLIFSAMISAQQGSRFVISKIPPQPRQGR